MTTVNSGRKGLNIKICKCLVSNLENMSNFQPLEVVDRGSETQPKVAENVNKLNNLNKLN